MVQVRTVVVIAMLSVAALSGCVGTKGPGSNAPPLPQALAAASTLTPLVGELVAFDASGGIAAGLDVASVAWDFGDGETGLGESATHAYALPGHYVVRLLIEDALGRVVTNDASLLYVNVGFPGEELADLSPDLPPVAVVAASSQVVQPGTTVSFDARASYAWVENAKFRDSRPIDGRNAPAVKDTAGIVEYAWEFGEGSECAIRDQTGPEPGCGGSVAGNATEAAVTSWTFESPGSHPVTLTVRAANGNTGAAVYTVYVPEPGAATPGGVKNPNVFTTATINGPMSLDPAYDYESAGGHVIQNVYETLVSYDRDNYNRLVPVLATEVPTLENGGISEDGLTYTFKLRRGVTFHDGTEMDANAVKFSIDRIVIMNDPSSPAWIYRGIKGAPAYMDSDGTAEDRATYLAVGGVSAADKYTVRVTLEKADSAFLFRMAFMGVSIVSPSAFKAPHDERTSLWGVAATSDGLPPAATADKARVTRDPWADTHAVGTGPYALRAWVPSDRVILDAYEGYWGAKPKMRTVIIQYVDDDNSRILMLLSGDVDEAYVPKTLVDRLRGESALRITELPSLSVTTILFGQDVQHEENCPRDRATGEVDCRALDDVHLRAAITHAFDKETYHQDILKGHAELVASVLPNGMAGHNPELAPHGRDLDAARAHLAKSRHPDGITNLVLATTKANSVAMEALELLKRDLGEIGIEATVLGLSFPDLIIGMHEQKWPMWMLGWNPDYAFPDNYVVPYLDGRAGEFAAGAGYDDPAMNALIDRALAESDPEAQEPIWREIEAKAHEDYLHLWLSQATNIHVERAWVKGYYYNPVDAGAPNFARYASASKA